MTWIRIITCIFAIVFFAYKAWDVYHSRVNEKVYIAESKRLRADIDDLKARPVASSAATNSIAGGRTNSVKKVRFLRCVEGQIGDAVLIKGWPYKKGDISPVGLIVAVCKDRHAVAIDVNSKEFIFLFPEFDMGTTKRNSDDGAGKEKDGETGQRTAENKVNQSEIEK
jgi:hypothetical protein